MILVCKMQVPGHFLSSYPSYHFLRWASRGLYVSSLVMRSTLSHFALGVRWPLCFLRTKDISSGTLNFYPSFCFGRYVAFMFFQTIFLQLPAYYLVPYARVVIPSSRMYLLLSKQDRLHFVISQLVIK